MHSFFGCKQFTFNPYVYPVNYTISFSEPNKRLFHIRLELPAGEETILRLAAWRPGRYELQNYAANILGFSAIDEKNKSLSWTKTAPTVWEIDAEHAKKVFVQYSFYANRLDAGGSFLDEDVIYINFINCIMYPDRGLEASVDLKLELPAGFQIAGDVLFNQNNHLIFNNYYEVFDSPIVASSTLQHFSYHLGETNFNAWFYGLEKENFEKLQSQFLAFTDKTLKIFGTLPSKEYHFLFLITPFAFYHGVEHRNSTVIVLGPNDDFETPKFQDELLGIACHELFHAWNICRIRPEELLPYDFSTYSLFETGYVAEGVTTYYGDYLLLKSNVFSEKRYFEEFDKTLNRYFHNYGRLNSSVAQSSLDLWVDGYVAGIPGKKVSIYNEGALAAFILDVEIRKATKNQKSLDQVMQVMWKEFGSMKKGYSPENYRVIAEKVAGVKLKNYFDSCINGLDGIEKFLPSSLDYLGLELKIEENKSFHASNFGFLTQWKDGHHFIKLIEPNSPAENRLAIGDIIYEINGMLPDVSLEIPLFKTETIFLLVDRGGMKKMISLSATLKTFLQTYSAVKKSNLSSDQKENYLSWAGN